MNNKMNCCQRCRREYVERQYGKPAELAVNMALRCGICGSSDCSKAKHHINLCTGKRRSFGTAIDIDKLMRLADEERK